LVRVGFIILFLPMWGEMMLPAKVRILLVLALALVLTPVVHVDLSAYPSTLGGMLYAVGMEAIFGFCVGFLVRLLFTSAQVAGQIAGEQMGFAVANVLAPDQSSQITIIAQYKYAFALLLFFAMNFHLVLFRAVAHSFELAPPFHLQPSVDVFVLVNGLTSAMFAMSVKMAAPILATMMLVYVALGLINKAAPQVNVLFESFPIRIILGLFMFSGGLGILARLLGEHLGQMDRTLLALFRAMA
jgi:flagellar biosynthetic protein FliR